MNVFTYQRITPNKSFPWFDEYSQHNTLCKVYNDGSAYIAVPTQKFKRKRYRTTVRHAIDDLFDQIYLQALKENVSKTAMHAYVKARLQEVYPGMWGLDDFVTKKIHAVYRNLAVRKKRFRRKAFLNPWNYFVTFTYDDEKQSEDSFKKKLRKCLSNLHTRRGWMYMGVFERAPETNRLHFHAIMYIPEGQMTGEIYERRDYSTKQHKMQVTHPNKFFEQTFGRNDFESLSEVELRRGSTMNYLLKYLEKTEERIIYSRGIPTDFYKDINDDDVVCEMVDFVIKYVLFNDVVDYDVDVTQTKAPLHYAFLDQSVPLPS